MPLNLFTPRLPEPLVIISDKAESKDLCQFVAFYQSFFDILHASQGLVEDVFHGLNFVFFKLRLQEDFRVSLFVIVTLWRNVGFCKFQRNNVVNHHRLDLLILHGIFFKMRWWRNSRAKMPYLHQLALLDHVRAQWCEPVHIFIRITRGDNLDFLCIFMCTYNDLAYVAWSCLRNVATILVGIAALPFDVFVFVLVISRYFNSS